MAEYRTYEEGEKLAREAGDHWTVVCLRLGQHEQACRTMPHGVSVRATRQRLLEAIDEYAKHHRHSGVELRDGGPPHVAPCGQDSVARVGSEGDGGATSHREL